MDKLNIEQIRGIDFAVSITAKSYPFIIGWQFSDYHNKNYSESFSIIYLDLIVDLEKVGDVFDFSISDYWIQQVKKEPLTDLSYLTSISKDSDGGTEDKKLIEEDMNLNYDNVPEVYKGKSLKKIYTYVGERKFVKPLSIHHYVTQPTQNVYYEIKRVS